MKTIQIALIALATAGAAMNADAQYIPNGGMPGIAVAGSVDSSMLPDGIRTFLEKNYPGVGIVKSEREFESGRYEIDLANGVDMDFSSTGKIDEISAPDNTALPEAIVRNILPRATIDHLHKNGYLGSVNEIDIRDKGGYKVQLVKPQPDELIYDVDGIFISFDD